MQLLIDPTGGVRCVYAEAIDLNVLGSVTIERGSHVEPTPTGEWTADLAPVTTEFENVTFDPKHGSIRVRTDRIVMEEIDLGRFEIVLDYRCLGEIGCYEVIAESPNPASENGDTTHPHVQNDTLCEGDGKTAIRSALSECRLLDFFLIVNQVLHNYKRDSAFTRLEDWQGSACPDCGCTVHTDDECTCEACSTTSCFECTTGCTTCSDRYCHGCIRTCADCDDSVCTACLAKCSACDETHCKGCLTNDKCESCTEEEETDSQEEAEEGSEEPTPNNPVHAVFMEQAVVLA